MENYFLLKDTRIFKRCVLLLLLTELMQPTITAPSYVTVGVPSSAQCTSECMYVCTYAMSVNLPISQGQNNSLVFIVNTWTDDLTISCSVTNGNRVTATAIKKIQVLVGPANISISGPDLMNPNVSHTFSCHAYCRPSCSYSWKIDQGPWISGQGNVMSMTPNELDNSRMLICKATNTVSKLFIAAIQDISVAVGPTDLQISGPDVLEVAEKAKFVCASICAPSCRYVSSVDTLTVRGNTVELIVEHPLKSITIKCEAQNTATRKTAISTKSVIIKGANSTSTRPDVTSVLLMTGVLCALSTL